MHDANTFCTKSRIVHIHEYTKNFQLEKLVLKAAVFRARVRFPPSNCTQQEIVIDKQKATPKRIVFIVSFSMSRFI